MPRAARHGVYDPMMRLPRPLSAGNGVVACPVGERPAGDNVPDPTRGHRKAQTGLQRQAQAIPPT